MSKKKYRAVHSSIIRQHNCQTQRRSFIHVLPDMRIPRLLSYHEVMQHVRSVDIGPLSPLPDVEGANHVPGFYRPLEDVLKTMAEMFISTVRLEKTLERFGKECGTFFFSIGWDGAPVGQAGEEMTLWCVSLLNRGRHVGSPNDNFLLLAAGCEDHPVLLAYAKQVAQEVEMLTGKQIMMAGVACSFI